MTERENRKTQVIFVTSDIRSLNFEIGKYFDEKRAAGWLESEARADFVHLQEIKNQRIIDLLLANSKNDWVKVHMIKFPGEVLHPFSMNRIGLDSPYDFIDTPYYFKAELSDLRRKGVCEDSLEAARLLGKYQTKEEHPSDFLTRTVNELRRLRTARGVALDMGSDFVVDTIDQISLSLVKDRLVGEKDQFPKFGMQSRITSAGGNRMETVRITTPDGQDYDFYWNIRSAQG